MFQDASGMHVYSLRLAVVLSTSQGEGNDTEKKRLLLTCIH